MSEDWDECAMQKCVSRFDFTPKNSEVELEFEVTFVSGLHSKIEMREARSTSDADFLHEFCKIFTEMSS